MDNVEKCKVKKWLPFWRAHWEKNYLWHWDTQRVFSYNIKSMIQKWRIRKEPNKWDFIKIKNLLCERLYWENKKKIYRWIFFLFLQITIIIWDISLTEGYGDCRKVVL